MSDLNKLYENMILEKEDEYIDDENDSTYLARLNIENDEGLLNAGSHAYDSDELKEIMMDLSEYLPDKDDIEWDDVDWGQLYLDLNEDEVEYWDDVDEENEKMDESINKEKEKIYRELFRKAKDDNMALQDYIDFLDDKFPAWNKYGSGLPPHIEHFLRKSKTEDEFIKAISKEGLDESVKGTKNIPVSVVRDAMGVAGGLYSMNAKSSVGYAFTVNRNKKSVATGEFRYSTEEYPTIDEFDGYIDFETKTLHDLESGQKVKLDESNKRNK
jgi:hypothetical protein